MLRWTSRGDFRPSGIRQSHSSVHLILRRLDANTLYFLLFLSFSFDQWTLRQLRKPSRRSLISQKMKSLNRSVLLISSIIFRLREGFGNGAYTELINSDGLRLTWRVQFLLRDLRGLTLLAVLARMVTWDRQTTNYVPERGMMMTARRRVSSTVIQLPTGRVMQCQWLRGRSELLCRRNVRSRVCLKSRNASMIVVKGRESTSITARRERVGISAR